MAFPFQSLGTLRELSSNPCLRPGSPLFPSAPRRGWIRSGLNERQEHIFTWMAVIVVLLFMTAWVGAIAEARRQQLESIAEQRALAKRGAIPPAPAPPVASPTQQIASSLLDSNASSTAFISDAMLGFLDPLRGQSGKVFFTTRTPGAAIVPNAPGGSSAVLTGSEGPEVSADFTAPDEPGVYRIAVQIDQASRAISDLNVITLVPFSEKHGGRIGTYLLGSWPFESKATVPAKAAYDNPAGFIEVTPANADTKISEHFKLRDFLTKDQPNVWPKYLLLNPKLLDKLELTIAELESTGHPVRTLHVMSGFRTPQYNHTGGNTQGRANLSRHMYGDASDVFVDNDGNSAMDDLNGDGRVDEKDAEVILAAVERVERRYPSLVGGVGVYPACCGHGPFTHIDVRGFRARWRGTGSG